MSDSGASAGDPNIHRSPDDTDIDLTEATQALHDWEKEEEKRREDAIRNRKPFEGLQVDPDIDFYPEVANREPGDRNIVRFGFDMHPQVTLASAGFMIAFISWTLLDDRASDVFGEILSFINEKLGWLYIIDFNIFLFAGLFFAFSRYGKIRLGGPYARPEFSTASWYAMLISAGIGIGLMFWGVAEPIYHLASPPPLFGADPSHGRSRQGRHRHDLPSLGHPRLGALRHRGPGARIFRVQPRTAAHVPICLLSHPGPEGSTGTGATLSTRSRWWRRCSGSPPRSDWAHSKPLRACTGCTTFPMTPASRLC